MQPWILVHHDLGGTLCQEGVVHFDRNFQLYSGNYKLFYVPGGFANAGQRWIVTFRKPIGIITKR